MYKFESKSRRLVVHGKGLGRVAIFEDGLFETDNELKGKYLIDNAEMLNLIVLEKPVEKVESEVEVEEMPVEDFDNVTKAEIKERLDEAGIEYSDRDNKEKLIEKLK